MSIVLRFLWRKENKSEIIYLQDYRIFDVLNIKFLYFIICESKLIFKFYSRLEGMKWKEQFLKSF
jgi:hypothetical protein